MRQRMVLGAIVLGLSAPLSAHDFWLAAEQWTPAAGAPVVVTAGIGEAFPTRTNFRSRENWLASWRVLGARGDVPATGDFQRDGLVMATRLNLAAPGAYLAVAEISAQTIEMKGQEFTDYLKEEGLERIIEARRAAGESDKLTTERYARYAKLAIRSGGGSGDHLTRPVRAKAEFVPSSDPTAARPGDAITVQLLAGGAPVAGAAVSAVRAGAGGSTRVMTDAGGRATFTIGHEGPWLIKTVHMVRLPPGAGAEWESFWVTLAFHAAAP